MTAYRNQGYAALMGLIAVVFTVVTVVSALRSDAEGAGRWIPVVPVLLLSAFCLLRLARAGVYADDDGIRIVNPLRTVRLPWERVQRFALRGAPAIGYAELVDGERVPLWGIRARNSSPGARRVAEALVDALNERLRESRRAPPPTP